ncbi:energy transducer TonB [Stigmatella aurantiaca]|uniref:TonB domain protein n=1 Tax=Stigmatella aurantiaca (strain DW4/3-1) TaxID=378806 RepID=Q08M93_STIAD|nr:energy transducer TonB [Stigmatella aurantiaca]ADO72688.1 TonB domain protein [Stigmatella aurantiaca DW4/3-1]EAU61600.1 TonB protein [Stigmatella aurantiaca DW4/3-1]
MFQSVIEHRGMWTGRFSAGTAVSVLLHAGVFAAAVFITSREPSQEPRKEPVLEFVRHVPPQPPRGNPTPPSTPEAAPRPKPKPKRNVLVQPSTIPPTPPEAPPAEPQPEAPPANDLPYVEGSHPDGVETGGVAGALPLPFMGNGSGQATGEDVLPFGDSMTPPQLMSGDPLEYTREAREARVRGLLIARCTITREGAVTGCRIIKGLPFMDGAALTALQSRRYRPVHYQGRPVSVSYTFHVKLDLPR